MKPNIDKVASPSSYLYTHVNVHQQNFDQRLIEFLARQIQGAEFVFNTERQLIYLRAPKTTMLPFLFHCQTNPLLWEVSLQGEAWIFCEIEWCVLTDRRALTMPYKKLLRAYKEQINRAIKPPTKASVRAQFSQKVFGKPAYVYQRNVSG